MCATYGKLFMRGKNIILMYLHIFTFNVYLVLVNYAKKCMRKYIFKIFGNKELENFSLFL